MGGGGGLHAFQALRDIDAGSAGAVLWASVMSGWFQERGKSDDVGQAEAGRGNR